MSDEQREDEDVEAHRRSSHVAAEPAEETEDEDNEVEAHVRKASARMDNVRHT
jgi:hypothetical protein